jgi:protein SCO1/2
MLLLGLLLAAPTATAKTWHLDGIVVALDPVARTMLVAHRAVPNAMEAMTMPFRVENRGEMDGLHPGARIEFDLVVSGKNSVARHVRQAPGPDVVIPPPKEQLRVGDPVPDFPLIDQNGDATRLSDLRGRVVVVNFLYTRCPLPDVCPRLAANFAALRKRLGPDAVLVSITVDPDFDTPPVLAEYALRWGAAAPGWLFLTGEVSRAAAALGEVYWTDEGSIGHNSTTSVIGRNGVLAARVDGTTWRIDQLRRLIEQELEKPE